MVQKKTLAISLASIVLVAGLSANAAFRSSSTGKGVAKPAPPVICVDVPATNTPCVETDDSAEYGDVLNLKNKAAASTLAKADIDALGLTIPVSVNLNNADTIAYLNSKLNANIASGNTPSPKKVSDISSLITGATTANVNLWVIGQAAAGGSYTITSAVLNNAGCEASLLADINTTASTLNSNIGSSNLSTSPSVTAVQNWATTTAGFGTGVSYQDVLDATDSGNGGWSIADFKAASTKGYSKSSADKSLYDDAMGASYTVHCRAEIDNSSASCTDLTKAQFSSAKTGSALLATKKTKAAAGTLTLADLTSLGLTTTTLGGSPTAYELDYLMSLLDTSSSATKADWQSTITSTYTAAKAAKWKISQIAAGDSEHPTSGLTIAMLEAAGMTSGAHTTVGASLAVLKTNITTSGLTTSSNGTAIDNWVTKAAGFNTSTTFATVNTAVTNGYTNTNYKLAEDLVGWTTSANDAAHFANCKTNTNIATGGAGVCSVTRAVWLPLDTPTFASIWSCGGLATTTLASCSTTAFSKGDSVSTSGTGILTLGATDTDGGIGYTLSGTNSSSFAINASTGAVNSSSNLAPGVYNFNVVATDATSASSTKAFTLTVTDSTNPTVVGTSAVSSSSVNSYWTNGTTVYSAASKFSDAGSLTYSINNAKFAVNASTGVITKNGSITSQQSVTVTATDAGGNSATITLTVPFTTTVTIYNHHFKTSSPNNSDGCCNAGFTPMLDAWKDYSYWDNKTITTSEYYLGGKGCVYGGSHGSSTRNIATWLDSSVTNCNSGTPWVSDSATCQGSHNKVLLCVDVTP